MRDNSIVSFSERERKYIQHPRSNNNSNNNSNNKSERSLLITAIVPRDRATTRYRIKNSSLIQGGGRGEERARCMESIRRSNKCILRGRSFLFISRLFHRRCIVDASRRRTPPGGRVQRKRSMLMPLINLRNRFISLRRGGPGRAAAKIHQEMYPHVRRSFVTWTPEKSDGGQQGFVSLTSNNLRLCGIEFSSYPLGFSPTNFYFYLAIKHARKRCQLIGTSRISRLKFFPPPFKEYAKKLSKSLRPVTEKDKTRG